MSIYNNINDVSAHYINCTYAQWDICFNIYRESTWYQKRAYTGSIIQKLKLHISTRISMFLWISGNTTTFCRITNITRGATWKIWNINENQIYPTKELWMRWSMKTPNYQSQYVVLISALYKLIM